MNLDFRCDQAMAGARAYASGCHANHFCAECRHAQLFTAQPSGAFCRQLDDGRYSQGFPVARSVRVLQPACRHYQPRPADDLEFAPPAILLCDEPVSPQAAAY